MINKAHELPVSRQVKLLKISRGTVYYLPKPVSTADLVLMRHIDKLHLEHPFMGARMLRDQLALLGLHVGRRHVRTLMRRMGIEALAPQPGTSKAVPGKKIYPYLLRHLPIIRANQVWAFTATEFTTAVLDQGCKLSMDGKGAWRDNVFVERVWRSVEYERVYLKAYDTVIAARLDIADYFGWYNSQRPHSKLDKIAPDKAYLDKLPKQIDAELKIAA